MKQAEAFNLHVERLVVAPYSELPTDTAKWLTDLDDKMHARLAAVGLVRSRNRSSVTLKSFLEDYFASVTVKASTATTYNQTRRVLVEHFGDGRPLREIEPMEGDQWRPWLKAQKLADSTIARRVKMARQIFKRAMKWKLISENPFAEVG
jgi:hypothetical protein